MKRFFQKSTDSAIDGFLKNKILICFNLLLIQQKKVHHNPFLKKCVFAIYQNLQNFQYF
jgi:hypothetical protein